MEIDMSQKEPVAKILRKGHRQKYDSTALINHLKEVLKKRNESHREASMRAGLDHAAIRRIISGQRPSVHTCVYLANHFGMNPNEMLLLAQWPELDIFSIETASAEKLPPEAVDVALRISEIKNANTRKKVADAVLILLEQYF
jgi:transcriptional regulator with XRE-family HTH domain